MKKKFQFSYERLLEFRHQQEEVARRDYMESVDHLDREKGNYKKMYADLDHAQATIFDIQENPVMGDVPRLSQLDQFMAGQKVRISRQREVVIKFQEIVEQKQEILIAAAKERKILEKLKEKRKEDYRQQNKKEEAKLNDELVVTRFRRSE